MERMRADSHSVVHSDPEISGGTPVFRGTRVPVQSCPCAFCLTRICHGLSPRSWPDITSAHQQNLKGFGLRMLIIRAPSNRMVPLRPLVDSVLKTLAAMSPGQLREVGG